MLRFAKVVVVSMTCAAVCFGVLQRGEAGERRELVLFPFDDYAVPFNKGLILTLLPGRKGTTNNVLGSDPDHPGNPVLNVGKPGDPDFPRAYFYGSVLKVDGEYRMWYSGRDNEKSRHICYAVSKDGLKWTKPKLGLVDYHGSTANNLVATDGKLTPGMTALVVYDKDDPDPQRRFKMIREITPAEIWASVSADGLTWHSLNDGKDIIKGSNLEPSGFIRHDGVYYLNGHGGPIPHPIQARGVLRPQKRMMVTLMSYDFLNWTDAGHLSFRRDNIPPRPVLDFDFNRGEQLHLGAGLWDRGNVILGFYGMYHNPLTDRREVTVDIGLVVSHDAIHFKEPVPDFQIIPGAKKKIARNNALRKLRDFRTSAIPRTCTTAFGRRSIATVRPACAWRLGHAIVSATSLRRSASKSALRDVARSRRCRETATRLHERHGHDEREPHRSGSARRTVPADRWLRRARFPTGCRRLRPQAAAGLGGKENAAGRQSRTFAGQLARARRRSG
ncbi:MAG: hypothetical protein QM775_27930 [Pirellulales bacterium]